MLVSVIIPTQSRTTMLRQAVASVLGQTFRDLELIIVPNAATAECEQAAREIAAEDARVRVVSRERPGLAGARNEGIRAARGKWVGFIDDDDIWLPEKLEKQLARAGESGADLVSCQAVGFNDGGDLAPLRYDRPDGLPLREALTIYNWLPGSASGAIVRKSVLTALGGFDERLPASEDWDMWRRIAWQHRLEILNAFLVRYRVHDSMSQNRRLMVRAELMVLHKMVFDSPTDLRPMVVRAWALFSIRLAYHIYVWVNSRTLGIPFRVVWAIKRMMGRPRAA